MSTKQLERRAARTTFEIREAADGTIGFRGYAAVFDQIAYGEVIRPGAFDKTLAENPDVRMLVNHAGVPIARTKSDTLTLSVDEKGLLAEVDSLDPENPTVKELVSALQRGDIDQMSFAFWPIIENRTDDGVRELLEVKIDDGDVSIVTVPWYDETTAELNSLERAFSDLARGRELVPECRDALLARIEQPTTGDRGADLARAVAEVTAEDRDLNGWTFSDLYDLLDRALDDLLALAGTYRWGYVIDISDTWFACYTGGLTWQIPFTVTAEGVVTLGDPVEVVGKMTYITPPADDPAPSTESSAPAGMTLEEALRYRPVVGAPR